MAWGREDRLQITIVNQLKRTYRDMLILHIPNGGKRNMLEAIKLKKMGVLAGAPDILIIPTNTNPGIHKLYFMEVKTDKGRQSAGQLDFENECLVRNVGYCQIRSVDDALLAMDAWQIKQGKAPLFKPRSEQKVF